MRYSVAWSDIISQNLTLKTAILSLSVISASLTILALRLALRDPVIIERACYSKVVETASKERTDSEVEAFIKEAIRQRFDSDALPDSSLLSAEEKTFRKQEEEDLAKSNMRQKVIVNTVKRDGDKATVDADRLISVGQVRSVLSFPLLITLASTSRSSANPYGLTAVNFSAAGKEGSQK